MQQGVPAMNILQLGQPLSHLRLSGYLLAYEQETLGSELGVWGSGVLALGRGEGHAHVLAGTNDF